jgi:hypothetical protein
VADCCRWAAWCCQASTCWSACAAGRSSISHSRCCEHVCDTPERVKIRAVYRRRPFGNNPELAVVTWHELQQDQQSCSRRRIALQQTTLAFPLKSNLAGWWGAPAYLVSSGVPATATRANSANLQHVPNCVQMTSTSEELSARQQMLYCT